MARIKSLTDISKKFMEVTPARATQYAEGVEKMTVDWAQVTAAAEPNYEVGVQGAISKKMFSKGVKAAGTEKMKEGVRTKGSVRYGPGVAVAGPAYEKGYSPYHAAIAALTLPPRRARRDPANLQRVAAIATALGRLKEQRG